MRECNFMNKRERSDSSIYSKYNWNSFHKTLTSAFIYGAGTRICLNFCGTVASRGSRAPLSWEAWPQDTCSSWTSQDPHLLTHGSEGWKLDPPWGKKHEPDRTGGTSLPSFSPPWDPASTGHRVSTQPVCTESLDCVQVVSTFIRAAVIKV